MVGGRGAGCVKLSQDFDPGDWCTCPGVKLKVSIELSCHVSQLVILVARHVTLTS